MGQASVVHALASRRPATSGSTAWPPAPTPPYAPRPGRREPASRPRRGRAPLAAAALRPRCAHRGAAPRRVRSPRWERTNHAGDPVTLLEGPAYVAGAAAAARLAAAARPGARRRRCGSARAFGALDDLAGDGASKGLQGPPRRAARGRVTTGRGQDRSASGATGLVARGPAPTGRPRRRRGSLDTARRRRASSPAPPTWSTCSTCAPAGRSRSTLLAALPLLAGAGRPAGAARRRRGRRRAVGVLRPDLAGTRDARRHRRQRRRRAARHRPASAPPAAAAGWPRSPSSPALTLASRAGRASPGSSSRRPGCASSTPWGRPAR